MEGENNNKLLFFLDILVKRTTKSFITNIYREPSFIGLYLSLDLFAPKTWKINLTKTLTHHVFMIFCLMAYQSP